MAKPIVLTHLSLDGVRDSLDPSTADPRKAVTMQNVYASDRFLGAAVVGRPGFQQAGSLLVTNAKVQGIAQFTRLDGTERTIAFCNGLMFSFNWTTRVWSQVVLSAGATLSTTNPIDAITFADKLI